MFEENVTLFCLGQIFPHRVVGRDKEKDVAVLKLDLPAEQLQKLRPVILGCSSNLMVGQKVSMPAKESERRLVKIMTTSEILAHYLGLKDMHL
jgi:hypothetical protein